MANNEYKTKEFQNKHRFALIKILIEEHKKYMANNNIVQLPKSIQDRTNLYLELSCNIVQWFKDHYKEAHTDKKYCKINDVYNNFTCSNYYYNLSKADKRKYNKSYFIDYFTNNIFFRKYYSDRYNNIRHVIRGWEEEINNEEV